MEDPKAKPSGMDAIKQKLAPEGSYLIMEMGAGPETAAMQTAVTKAVGRLRDRGVIGCDIHRDLSKGRVFFVVKLEADKVDDVMNDFFTFAGAGDCKIYVYRRCPIQVSVTPTEKNRPEG